MASADRNSDLSQIAVTANNIPDVYVDCGIRWFGWCNGAYCQKFARLRFFIIVLSIAGLLQGTCETYFRVSAKQAALENDYNPIIIEWLLVTSGLVQAVFALALAYWAHKYHQITWLGGAIILQGLTCLIAIIPAVLSFSSNGPVTAAQTDSSNICATNFAQLQKAAITQQQNSVATLILLFAVQFVVGIATLAFYIIGIVYIDDNSPSVDSPAVIATTLAAKVLGLQIGSFLVLGVGAANLGWWLGWAILAPLVVTSGILLGLFPKSLPKTIIHRAAQNIIEETRTRQFGSQFSTYMDDTDFRPTVKRVFGNKLLMFNILSIMFIQSANVNYMLQEESYLQSRFYLPYNEEDGLLQEWKARFVSYFLKPPVAAVGMLIGGLVISKLKLSGRKITGINIALGIHLIAIYVAFVFIKCDVGPIAGLMGGKLQQPFCSRQCICKPTTFLPVCPENTTVTYFSPCYAGCTSKTTINSIELYESCTCGMDYLNAPVSNVRATEGPCSAANCAQMLIVYQIMSLSAATIFGMTTIGKIIITLRSVLPQDKAIALAMEIMFFGLFAYVPTHLAYDIVTRTTCVYWASDYSRCLMRETPKHGNILNILSASLVLVGILFDVLVFIYVKGLNIYNCKVTDVDYTPSLYSPIPHDDDEHPSSLMNQTQLTTLGGSSAAPSVQATNSPLQRRGAQSAAAKTAMPRSEITVFRNPSDVTNSSAGETSSLIDPQTGVAYAQIVFPPDKHKPNDGTTSPKRMAVRADVPLHHLSAQDVRAQLGNLKSFNAPGGGEPTQTTAATSNNRQQKPVIAPIETDLDLDLRPQSPETDF